MWCGAAWEAPAAYNVRVLSWCSEGVAYGMGAVGGGVAVCAGRVWR